MYGPEGEGLGSAEGYGIAVTFSEPLIFHQLSLVIVELNRLNRRCLIKATEKQ